MPFAPRTTYELEQARERRAEQVAEWSKLPLRQAWADEAHMREHLSAARVRIASNAEPAATSRVRQILRRAGLLGEVTNEALGMAGAGYLGIAGYLRHNPGLPLWVAVASILGRYDERVRRTKVGDGLD